MSWIPGWDSIAGTTWWGNFYFWAGIVALLALGVFEVFSHRYGERKDELVAELQDETQRSHDQEMARLHLETAKANSEAARLRLELDREIQKRAQRILTDEQKSALAAELRGKLSEIAIVTQNDPEAFAFSLQIMNAFGPGITVYAPEAPREDRWFAPAGLLMYSPLGQNEEQLKDDPLYRALKAANLFGGTLGKPFTSGQPRPLAMQVLPGYNGRVLYIGQKSPF